MLFANTGWLSAVLLAWLSGVDGDVVQQQAAVGAAGSGPCAGGDWGRITSDPVDAIHVRAGGDDAGGDGSEGNPFSSVARAVDEARTRPIDLRKIAIGPGDFDTNVTLDSLDDDGLVIQGCGPDETILRGASSAPVLDLAVNGDVELAGLGITEGVDALTIRDGNLALVDDVKVSDTKGRGVHVTGAATIATLQNVDVVDVNEGAACGWGVQVTDAMVLWFGGNVDDTKAVGVLAEGADLVLDNVVVQDMSAHVDGTLGRGLHAQDSWVMVADSTFVQTKDAAIFLLEPRGGVIGRIVIDVPSAGIVAPGGATTGDGIVLKGTAGPETVYLVDNLVEDAPRAAVLLEDIRVGAGGNAGVNTGLFAAYGAHAFRQGISQVAGPDAPGVLDISAVPEDFNDAWVSCAP